MELRSKSYELKKFNMALMQMQAKHNHKHFKTWIQQDIMKLHAILSKFHIGHDPNGATVQHTHMKQV